MNYYEYFDVYESLTKKYQNSMTEENWKELQSAEERFISSANEAISQGDDEAAIKLADYYYYTKINKSGDRVKDSIKAESVMEIGDVWKNDIWPACYYAMYCDINGHYDKAIGLKELFKEDRESGFYYVIEFAEEWAEIFTSSDSIIKEDLQVLCKKFMEKYAEDHEEIDEIFALSYISDIVTENEEYIQVFAYPIEQEINGLRDGTTTPQPEKLGFYTSILGSVSIHYGSNGDNVFASYYLALAMYVEDILIKDGPKDFIKRYIELFRGSFLASVFPFRNVSEDADALLTLAAVLMSKIDVSAKAWLGYKAFTDKKYDLCFQHLTEVMNSGICKEYPECELLWEICQFKLNRKNADSFIDAIAPIYDNYLDLEDEENVLELLCILDDAGIGLLSQRWAFYGVEKLPTINMYITAAFYYLYPVGDIKRDEESAYKMFAEAAKLGDEESKKELKNFRRSLFGKLSYVKNL